MPCTEGVWGDCDRHMHTVTFQNMKNNSKYLMCPYVPCKAQRDRSCGNFDPLLTISAPAKWWMPCSHMTAEMPYSAARYVALGVSECDMF
jgi:hypothetical protein